eukprot:6221792-Heterocapsa_arctica.AAC.1
MAHRAAYTAEHNDNRAAFKIIRLLGGFSPRCLKSVRLRDGALARSSDQCAERWKDHFTELFVGARLPDSASTATEPCCPVPVAGFRPSPAQ